MQEFFKKINFPYERVRSGQDEFIKRVFLTIKHNKNILVSAPTGSGKTISALAPALFQGKRLNKTVICLTSRQTQANQVINTIRDISKQSGEKIKYVAYIGKRSMCTHEDRDLHPASDFLDFCKRVRETGKCGYYKNARNSDYEDSMKKIIDETSENFYSVEEFIKITANARPEATSACGFCPYEIAGMKSFKADVVVADYNYLFQRGIAESFLGKIGRELEDCVIVVDEAHNLPDRVRSANSYSLSSEILKSAMKELNDYIKTSKYDNYLIHLKSVMDDLIIQNIDNLKDEVLITKEEVIDNYLKRFVTGVKLETIIDELEDAEIAIKEQKITSYLGSIILFLKRWKSIDEEGYIRTIFKETRSDKTISYIRLKCLDPSEVSAEVLNKSHSSILMSGTLTPVEMYRDILGVANSTILELDSPFEHQNQLTLVDDNITTKYSSRTPKMYQAIADNVVEILNSQVQKNAIVFFPSYALMDQVLAKINLLMLNRKVLKEQRYMTKEEKEDFVEQFKSKTSAFDTKAKVLFAITSGSFAEGLDLPSDFLELVLVVGLPLAVPDTYTNSLIRYFDKKFRKGELYGYVYPAMNKIIQAAGRCIRTEDDRGAVVLMDNRFLWPKYALSFPKHWKLKTVNNNVSEIDKFFEEKLI